EWINFSAPARITTGPSARRIAGAAIKPAPNPTMNSRRCKVLVKALVTALVMGNGSSVVYNRCNKCAVRRGPLGGVGHVLRFGLRPHVRTVYCLSMIFSENRYPPIGSSPEGLLFRIMLWGLIHESDPYWCRHAATSFCIRSPRRAGDRLFQERGRRDGDRRLFVHAGGGGCG